MGGSMGGGGLLDGYTNARDMFDGGGAGKSGAEFEGGGLLSLIANAIGKPLGSQRRQPTQMMRPQARPVMGSTGPVREPQQSYTYVGPEPIASQPPVAPLQYGPPARSRVGSSLMDALYPSGERMQYGPETRPMVGPNFRNSRDPVGENSPQLFMPQMSAPESRAPTYGTNSYKPQMPDSLPRVDATTSVGEFEEYLMRSPKFSAFLPLIRDDHALAENLFLQWVANGKKLPGM
jgi:hypothetical protein